MEVGLLNQLSDLAFEAVRTLPHIMHNVNCESAVSGGIGSIRAGLGEGWRVFSSALWS